MEAAFSVTYSHFGAQKIIAKTIIGKQRMSSHVSTPSQLICVLKGCVCTRVLIAIRAQKTTRAAAAFAATAIRQKSEPYLAARRHVGIVECVLVRMVLSKVVFFKSCRRDSVGGSQVFIRVKTKSKLACLWKGKEKERRKCCVEQRCVQPYLELPDTSSKDKIDYL